MRNGHLRQPSYRLLILCLVLIRGYIYILYRFRPLSVGALVGALVSEQA